MANMEEIDETIEYIISIDKIDENNNLTILQCVAMYGDPQDRYAI